jgi:outer membrane lipoprotein-sorting protein
MARTGFLGLLVRMLLPLVVVALAAGALGGCGKRLPEKGVRPGASAEDILTGAADYYASLRSFSERTTITETVSGPDGEEVTTRHTDLDFVSPNLLLYKITGEEEMVLACDGERLTVYSSARNGYVRQDAPEDLAALLREQETGTIGLSELMLLAGADPHETLINLTAAEDASVDGVACAVVSGEVKQIEERGADEPAAAMQRLWIGREDSLIHKTVLEVQRGKAKLRIEEVMDELSAHQDPPDVARISYDPPEGARNLVEE